MATRSGHVAKEAKEPDEPTTEEIFEALLERKLRGYRRIVVAFCAGLLVMGTVDTTIKFAMLRGIAQLVYPPDLILDRITEVAEERAQEGVAVVPDAVSEQIVKAIPDKGGQTLGFSTLPRLKQELPPEVWETVQRGDRPEYDAIMRNDEFADALKDLFYDEMTIAYETITNINPEDFKDEIRRKGKVHVGCSLVPIAERFEGDHTTCGIRLRHSEKQAIVVVPRDDIVVENKGDSLDLYAWLRCYDSKKFPASIRLGLVSYPVGNVVEDVHLVGFERTGSRPVLEIRLTRAVAKEFDLWPNSTGAGEVWISEVR